MNEIVDSVGREQCARADDCPLELRIFRSMIATVAITVIAGMMLAPWRVTAGLMLGGMLSLLNYHWLRTSMATVFASSTSRTGPRIGVVRYVFRYLVVAAVAAIAYRLRIVSLPAMIVGLCSFVVAFFVEVLRQSYFVIVGREESF